ncbi:MAG: AbrB/MazE/SpoVT family DNA-binding domain-containing protein [Dehalococcoidia bacterium]
MGAARQAIVGKGRRVTIPRAILEKAALAEGQAVSVESTPEGVLLRPVERDPDQWWFWTEEWQAGERAADEDLKAGRFRRHMSSEDFIRSLESRLKPLD